MLKRSQVLNLLHGFLCISLLMLATLGQSNMQVVVKNSPGFFYGKACQNTFSFIINRLTYSQLYLNLGMVPRDNSMLPVSQKIGPTTLMQINQFTLKPVEFWTDYKSLFSFNAALFNHIRYNLTHNMFTFTLTNLICPAKYSEPQILYTAQLFNSKQNFKIENYMAKASTSFTWTNLKYSFTQRVLVNPLLNQDLSYFYPGTSNIPKQVKSIYVGSKQNISFVFDIKNITEQNYWQMFKVNFIKFTEFSKEISIDTKTCRKSISYGIKNSKQYQTPQPPSNVPCTLSADNSLIFWNQDYVQDSYIYNSAYSTYGLFKSPGVRVNLTIQVTFKETANVQMFYQIVSRTSKKIDGKGSLKLLNSPQEFILFDSSNSPEIINLIPVSGIAPDIPPPVPVPASRNSILSVTGLSIISFLVISILGSVWIFIDFKKPTYNENIKFPLFLFIIVDPLIKLVFYVYIKNYENSPANIYKKDSSIDSLFIFLIAMEYLLLNLIWLICYLYNSKNSQTIQDVTMTQIQVKQTSKIMLIVSIIYSYKLYCITFLGLHKSKSSNKPNFTMRQLKSFSLVFRVLLGVQIAIVCSLVFCFGRACLNEYVISGYCFYQCLFFLMLVVLFRYIYLHNKIKSTNDTQFTEYDDKTMFGTTYGASQASGFATGNVSSRSTRHRSKDRKEDSKADKKQDGKSSRIKSHSKSLNRSKVSGINIEASALPDKDNFQSLGRNTSINKTYGQQTEVNLSYNANATGKYSEGRSLNLTKIGRSGRSQSGGKSKIKDENQSKFQTKIQGQSRRQSKSKRQGQSKSRRQGQSRRQSRIQSKSRRQGQSKIQGQSRRQSKSKRQGQSRIQSKSKRQGQSRIQSKSKRQGQSRGQSKSKRQSKIKAQMTETQYPDGDSQYAKSQRKSKKQGETKYQQSGYGQTTYKNQEGASEYKSKIQGKDSKLVSSSALDYDPYPSLNAKQQPKADKYRMKIDLNQKQYTVARENEEAASMYFARQSSIFQKQTMRDNNMESMTQRSFLRSGLPADDN